MAIALAGLPVTTTARTPATSCAAALQALGTTMGAELPKIPGGNNTVLYPASVKASTDLQSSLAASGFTVERINTYNTVCGRYMGRGRRQQQ